jgi:hypothetical protein
MNYYDDYSDCVFGICSCQTIHRIKRCNLTENAKGYTIRSPFKCSYCGWIHEEIAGHSRTPEIEEKYKKESWKIFYRR